MDQVDLATKVVRVQGGVVELERVTAPEPEVAAPAPGLPV